MFGRIKDCYPPSINGKLRFTEMKCLILQALQQNVQQKTLWPQSTKHFDPLKDMLKDTVYGLDQALEVLSSSLWCCPWVLEWTHLPRAVCRTSLGWKQYAVCNMQSWSRSMLHVDAHARPALCSWSTMQSWSVCPFCPMNWPWAIHPASGSGEFDTPTLCAWVALHT